MTWTTRASVCAVAVTLTASLTPRAHAETPTRAAGSVVRQLEERVAMMELSAARYADWEACLRGVPISEYGDPDRQSGYRYDERDGTGESYMPALAVDRSGRPGRRDYLFLSFARGACTSSAPAPGGTADASTARRPDTLRSLERRVRGLKRAARRLSAAAERFDAWESCLSWVPVTEYGDPEHRFGYLFGAAGTPATTYRPALAVDRSAWDDPDYMFLAFAGDDRPGGVCQDEPGEGVD